MGAKIKKSERLIYLLNFLSPSTRVSLRELAKNCGTSERTIYRDVNELTRIGYAILYDQGYYLKSSAPHSVLNKLAESEIRMIKFALETHPLGNVFPFDELAGKLKCSDITFKKGFESPPKYENRTINRMASIDVRGVEDSIDVAED